MGAEKRLAGDGSPHRGRDNGDKSGFHGVEDSAERRFMEGGKSHARKEKTEAGKSGEKNGRREFWGLQGRGRGG